MQRPVRRSKTNQVGETSDVRYLNNGAARAAAAPPPEGRVVPRSLKACRLARSQHGRSDATDELDPGADVESEEET